MSRKSAEAKALHLELDSIKEELIQAVKNAPIIWDIAHQSYNYTNLKDNAWDSIVSSLAQKFGASTLVKQRCESRGQLKDLWKNLRNQYKAYRRSNKMKSGAGAAEVKPIKWRFYRQMSFLQQSVVAIPTSNSMKFVRESGDMDPESSERVECSSQADYCMDLGNLTDSEMAFQESVDLEMGGTGSEPYAEQGCSVTPWSPSKQRKKRAGHDLKMNRKEESRQARDEAFHEALQVLKQPATESESMTFCRYLATQLDKINDGDRDALQFELLQCVHEALEKQRTR